jgi:TonB family protein
MMIRAQVNLRRRFTVGASALLLCVTAAAGLAQTPATPARAMRLDAKAPPPTRIAGNMPAYPADARQRRIGGLVSVDITIDPKGKVTDAKVVRSIPALEAAAADAVRLWEFRITAPLLNGSPVPAVWTVVFYFDADTGRVDEVQRIAPLGPQPKKTKNVAPIYPPSMRGGRTGQVVLEAVVSRAGKVIDMRVLSGTGAFESAAREAVRQWEYAPLVVGGAPVPFVLTVTVLISPR